MTFDRRKKLCGKVTFLILTTKVIKFVFLFQIISSSLKSQLIIRLSISSPVVDLKLKQLFKRMAFQIETNSHLNCRLSKSLSATTHHCVVYEIILYRISPWALLEPPQVSITGPLNKANNLKMIQWVRRRPLKNDSLPPPWYMNMNYIIDIMLFHSGHRNIDKDMMNETQSFNFGDIPPGWLKGNKRADRLFEMLNNSTCIFFGFTVTLGHFSVVVVKCKFKGSKLHS